jgi:peptide/nickel transport system ATP-binding protein
MLTKDRNTSRPLLEVRNLTASFLTSEGKAVAVNDISFHLDKGQTLGIVGESGCGKTVTALSILRLIGKPGIIESGEIIYEGIRLDQLSETAMQSIRGNEISIVFQEPMSSLNPVYRIGHQIMEPVLKHRQISKQEAKNLALSHLRQLGIADPERVFHAYPEELSGGMRQRVLIAMALICDPKILIADEPTTALDATVQTQIIAKLSELKAETGLSVIIITHDLGVVAEICDRVIVMYASKIVEEGSLEDIFYRPQHPYTIGLLNSLPSAHRATNRLPVISGQVPRATNYPDGCNFEARCNHATERCVFHDPVLEETTPGHFIFCWNKQSLDIGSA